MAEAVPNLAPFLRLLRNEDDERVFELEKLVSRTQETPGWEILMGLLEVAEQASLNELRYLQAKEHAQMAREIGWGAGLCGARDAANAVLHEAEKRRAQIKRVNERREAVPA